MTRLIRTAIAAAAVTVLPTVASAQAPTKNIVQTAVDAGTFNTLVAAVKAAGLVETLSGPGPFTVFAPSDAAFAKLPAGTIDALLKDKAALTSILTYLVVPGKIMAADVLKMKSGQPATVNGQKINVVVRDGKVFVDGAQVVATDIVTTNGVIHVIDAVVMPKAK